MRILTALLLLLPACVDTAEETDTPPSADTDACVPTDEVCDGEDNDCDGEIDEDAADAQPFFADADRDGAGDAGVRVEACERPEGYVPQPWRL